MRSLLTLVGLGVVVFLGLGWYLGWYKVSSTQGVDGKHWSIEVNQGKVTNDTTKIINNVQEHGVTGVFDGFSQPQNQPQGFPQQSGQPGGSPAFYIDNNGNMVFKPANILGGNNQNPTLPNNITQGIQNIFGGGNSNPLPAPR